MSGSKSPLYRLSKSIVGQAECEAAQRVLLEDGYLGMGAEVQAFETDIAHFLGVPKNNVVCVNSGTAALHLAIQALTNPGDEVLVQSLTFISSFQAISAVQRIPVACEVLPETITIDVNDAERRFSSRTKAIMPIHYASNPGTLDSIYAFARRHDIRIIEDAAHAFGCTYNGRKIGSFGDIVCFSFDGIKNITSGEGGAMVTSDKDIAEKARNARLLGVERDTEQRFSGLRSWEFDVHHQGYRYHMSNVHAAIGRVQLRRFEKEFKPRRIELARKYRSNLNKLSGIKLLDGEPGAIVPHIFPVRLLDGRRDALRAYLIGHGIECGIHYKPNHLLSYYGARKGMLPLTERLYKELLSLPLHPGLSDDEIGFVIDRVSEFLNA